MLVILPLPPSINATYKTGNGNFYKSKVAREWEEAAGWKIKRLKSSYNPTDRLYMQITFYFQHDRDIDSGIKILLDLFQKMNVYPNDKMVYKLEVKKVMVKIKPHCEILLEVI